MAKLIVFNKPFQVLSQFTDEGERRTLSDFIDVKAVYPAGRLDYDSEGLMLLTDDGKLQSKISHPKSKLTKTYWVQVEGAPEAADLQPLIDGMELKDGLCLPVRWAFGRQPQDTIDVWPRQPPIRQRKNIPTTWLTLTLKEGRNRQVRRMCAGLGFPVLRLIRYRVGSWTIDGIAPGEFAPV